MAKTSLTAWPSNIVKFIKESRDELKKVSWPSRQTTIRYTFIVVVASLIVGLVTGAFDYALTLILEKVVL
jgi:preprotein translocase subunit SecE